MNQSEASVFFASDLHLGTPNYEDSRQREDKFIRWLDSITPQLKVLYLMGDVFDYWFEYKTVVPKGYVRLLGKMAFLSDAGVAIHIFTGNHDLWMRDYFEKEMNIRVYKTPQVHKILGKTFFLAHGDGLGPKDYGYKWLKKVFINPFCQWAYRQVHPDLSTRVATFFSKSSRNAQTPLTDLGENLDPNNEWLYLYAQKKLTIQHYDYFIFGHRHLPINLSLSNESRYINLGDWINFFTYAKFDGENLELCRFDEH
ncbi:MAG: UDP-2,3-diacylglucosamine diphosphatase [Chitinophagales bacterium]